MTALRTLLLRLTACGLFCGFVLTLGEKSGQKEILRFSCACLMVVVLLSSLRGMRLPDWQREERNRAFDTEDVQQQQKQEILSETEAALSRWIIAQGERLSVSCDASVICRELEGEVTVERVELTLFEGKAEARSKLLEQICQSLALSPERVAIREG